MSQQAESYGQRAYAEKSDDYFSAARKDLVDQLPDNPTAKILEIGCGAGGTGQYALAKGKCQWYGGVEISASAAETARQHLNEVITGDVESIEFPWEENTFDALIMSEVIEHLNDPWEVVKRLRPLLKKDAIFFCTTPNVSHYYIIKMLFNGEWTLEDEGIMDRTHLRWFTPKTLSELAEDAGFTVEYVGAGRPPSLITKIRTFIFGGRSHLFIRQMILRARAK